MSDEEKVNTEQTEVRKSGIPTPGRRVWPVIMSIIAVVGVVVVIGFLHWHEEPTFCSSLCHSTMATYVDGYYSGDEGLEVTAHSDADVTCLGCHWTQAKMLDLVNEVYKYAFDLYTDPLTDMGSEFINDEFCGACHDGETAPTKEEATADWAEDPHNIPDIAFHESIDASCSSCHSIHNASTMICSECHSDATVPTGWISLAPQTTTTTDDSSSSSASSEAISGADVADGTYTGTGTGRNGDFDVTVTVENGAITSVVVGDNEETQGIGTNAIDQLPDEIVAANGTEGVDDVAGATLTSEGIKEAVNNALEQGAK